MGGTNPPREVRLPDSQVEVRPRFARPHRPRSGGHTAIVSHSLDERAVGSLRCSTCRYGAGRIIDLDDHLFARRAVSEVRN